MVKLRKKVDKNFITYSIILLYSLLIVYLVWASTPLITGVYLNSTTNGTCGALYSNLSVNWTINQGGFQNITVWYLNNISIMMLNLPMENISNTTRTYDYSGFGKIGNVSNVNYSSTGGYDGFGAYEFNYSGTPHNISFGDDDSLIGINYTWSLWFKEYEITNGEIHDIFAKWKTTATQSGIWVLADYPNSKDLTILSASGGAYVIQHANFVTGVNTWVHLAITANDTSFTLFKDGVRVNSTGNSNYNMVSNNFPFCIGYACGGFTTIQRFFNGTIDDFMIFNRTLSDEQIKFIFENKSYLLSSQETKLNDVWYANVTPVNSSEKGISVVSNSLEIVNICPAPPVVSGVYLNSTLGTNKSDSNLTVNWTNYDINGDNLKNITTWYLNNNSIMLLNMPFEGGSNNTYAKDYSGYGNDGIPYGLPNITWCSTCGHDGFGAYRFLDNKTSNITIANGITTGGGVTADTGFTVSFWINLANMTPSGIIMNNNYSVAPKIGWRIIEGTSNPNQLVFWAGNRTSLSQYSYTSSTLSPNVWYHYTLVWNTTHATTYLNGQINEGIALANRYIPYINGTGAPLLIGGDGQGFNGTIDDLMIFNRTLSDEQIKFIFENKSQYILSSNELKYGDYWYANVTANDGIYDSVSLKSNPITLIWNRVPFFYNISLEPNATSWIFKLLTTFNGTGTIGDLDSGDFFNISIFWYEGDNIIISNNTAGSNMSNLTSLSINGSMGSTGDLTLNLWSLHPSNYRLGYNYSLGIYVCDSGGLCNQSNSTALMINITNNGYICSNIAGCEYQNLTEAVVGENNTLDTKMYLLDNNTYYSVAYTTFFNITKTPGLATTTFEIKASNITFDCNSTRMIQASGINNGKIINVDSQDNITIQNCYFANGTFDTYYNNINFLTVKNNVFYVGDEPIHVVLSRNVTISNNTIIKGIACIYGIYLLSSNNVTANNNYIEGCDVSSVLSDLKSSNYINNIINKSVIWSMFMNGNVNNNNIINNSFYSNAGEEFFFRDLLAGDTFTSNNFTENFFDRSDIVFNISRKAVNNSFFNNKINNGSIAFIINSSSNIIWNNTIINMTNAFRLIGSNNQIINNTIKESNYPINISFSRNNNITGNSFYNSKNTTSVWIDNKSANITLWYNNFYSGGLNYSYGSLDNTTGCYNSIGNFYDYKIPYSSMASGECGLINITAIPTLTSSLLTFNWTNQSSYNLINYYIELYDNNVWTKLGVVNDNNFTYDMTGKINGNYIINIIPMDDGYAETNGTYRNLTFTLNVPAVTGWLGVSSSTLPPSDIDIKLENVLEEYRKNSNLNIIEKTYYANQSMDFTENYAVIFINNQSIRIDPKRDNQGVYAYDYKLDENIFNKNNTAVYRMDFIIKGPGSYFRTIEIKVINEIEEKSIIQAVKDNIINSDGSLKTIAYILIGITIFLIILIFILIEIQVNKSKKVKNKDKISVNYS